MLADPLTKAMLPDRLDTTMMTGKLDLRPTQESLMIKERNRASRKKQKEAAKEGKSDDPYYEELVPKPLDDWNDPEVQKKMRIITDGLDHFDRCEYEDDLRRKAAKRIAAQS